MEYLTGKGGLCGCTRNGVCAISICTIRLYVLLYDYLMFVMGFFYYCSCIPHLHYIYKAIRNNHGECVVVKELSIVGLLLLFLVALLLSLLFVACVILQTEMVFSSCWLYDGQDFFSLSFVHVVYCPLWVVCSWYSCVFLLV